MSLLKTYEFVDQLCGTINDMYKINPKVFLSVDCVADYDGNCTISRKKSDIFIEVCIPHDIKLTSEIKMHIASTVVHEYCHYLTDYAKTTKERVQGIKAYDNDIEKLKEERRTWAHTKKLAKELGLWNKEFFNIIKKSCVHADRLKF